MGEERREIHAKLEPHVHKGEELYYEISGYHRSGKVVQSVSGVDFVYDCTPREYRVMLYRVTITTPDGYRIDLDREQVYQRAEELGLEKPILLDDEYSLGDDYDKADRDCYFTMIVELADGMTVLGGKHIKEGIVVWFKDCSGNWTCLKHKSEEFLMLDSRNKDKGFGDVEDEL